MEIKNIKGEVIFSDDSPTTTEVVSLVVETLFSFPATVRITVFLFVASGIN